MYDESSCAFSSLKPQYENVWFVLPQKVREKKYIKNDNLQKPHSHVWDSINCYDQNAISTKTIKSYQKLQESKVPFSHPVCVFSSRIYRHVTGRVCIWSTSSVQQKLLWYEALMTIRNNFEIQKEKNVYRRQNGDYISAIYFRAFSFIKISSKSSLDHQYHRPIKAGPDHFIDMSPWFLYLGFMLNKIIRRVNGGNK